MSVIHVFPGVDGQFYVRIVSVNGQTLLVSEGYTRKWNAKRAAKKLSSIFGLRIREVKQ
jgi:uncharacterized protein YegP (UPF0339 family)